jgi:hypothetical protein
MAIFGTEGQGLKQFIELGTAFLFSALIGLDGKSTARAPDFAPTPSSAPLQHSFCSSPNTASQTFVRPTWSSLTRRVSPHKSLRASVLSELD